MVSPVADSDAAKSSRVKRVVVLGGSGRVGRSTAFALAASTRPEEESSATDSGWEPPQLDLVVSGRDRCSNRSIARKSGVTT